MLTKEEKHYTFYGLACHVDASTTKSMPPQPLKDVGTRYRLTCAKSTCVRLIIKRYSSNGSLNLNFLYLTKIDHGLDIINPNYKLHSKV